MLHDFHAARVDRAIAHCIEACAEHRRRLLDLSTASVQTCLRHPYSEPHSIAHQPGLMHNQPMALRLPSSILTFAASPMFLGRRAEDIVPALIALVVGA